MKNLLFFLFIICVGSISAQDIIYKTNGEKVSASVFEIDPQFISYKQFDNPQGPTYKLGRKEILRIEYQNGKIEKFSEKEAAQKIFVDSELNNKNIVAFDFVSIVFSELGFSYERIFANGFLGVKIPLIFGLNTPRNEIKDVTANFVTGFDLNFYPAGQGRVKYFVGPGIRTGTVKVNSYSYYGNFSNAYEQRIEKMQGFLVNNGVVFQPSKSITINLVLGIGIRNVDTRRSDFIDLGEMFGPNFVTFGSNIAYRF